MKLRGRSNKKLSWKKFTTELKQGVVNSYYLQNKIINNFKIQKTKTNLATKYLKLFLDDLPFI